MAIKQLYGKTYYADFTDTSGTRRRVSLQTTNLKVAQLKYAEIIHKRNTIKEKMVVDLEWDAFKIRLFKFMLAERSKSTITWTKLAIQHLEEVQKPRLLRDVTPVLVQRVKEYMLEKGYGKHNINRCMQALKAVMHLAEKWGLVPEQSWKIVTKLKIPKGRVVYHTDEEIELLLAACPSHGWIVVILLGCDAGLRRGEIAQLRWQDVDFENNQIYVAPDKTVNHRYVPMTNALRKALEKAAKSARNEFVVDVGRESSRSSKDFLTAFYRQIAKKAGVKSFMHKLRHTFASRLVQSGVDLYSVSNLLGHSSIKMTEIYAHLTKDTLRKAVERLPERSYVEKPPKHHAAKPSEGKTPNRIPVMQPIVKTPKFGAPFETRTIKNSIKPSPVGESYTGRA